MLEFLLTCIVWRSLFKLKTLNQTNRSRTLSLQHPLSLGGDAENRDSEGEVDSSGECVFHSEKRGQS